MDRLEGLAGLSVQDAELKLFADQKPADAEQSDSSNSKEDINNNNNKAKKGKKQAAVSQRGPLLITHTGEPYVVPILLFCVFVRISLFLCFFVFVSQGGVTVSVLRWVLLITLLILHARLRRV